LRFVNALDFSICDMERAMVPTIAARPQGVSSLTWTAGENPRSFFANSFAKLLGKQVALITDKTSPASRVERNAGKTK
jgi:hypothetical protein